MRVGIENSSDNPEFSLFHRNYRDIGIIETLQIVIDIC